MEKQEKNARKENRGLLGVLLGLSVVAVGLVVVIIVVSSVNGYDIDIDGVNESIVIEDTRVSFEDDEEIEGSEYDEEEEYDEEYNGVVDCSKIDELRQASEISGCLDVMYGQDEKSSLNTYQKKIDEAFRNSDEYKYLDLLFARVSLVGRTLGCEQAYGYLDDERAEKLSERLVNDYYILARDFAEECEDEVKRDYYENKIDLLIGDEQNV